MALAASMWSQDHAAQEASTLSALVALARARRTLMAAWRTAATTLGVELPPGETFPAAGLAFALRQGGVVIEVRVAQDGPPPRVWHTSLRARFVSAGDAPLAFHVHADPRRREVLLDTAIEHDAAARAHITVELKRLLFATEGVATRDGGGAVIVWAGEEPDAAHLAQAATIVASWAAAPAGRAYR